jgi:hypothetical protein
VNLGGAVTLVRLALSGLIAAGKRPDHQRHQLPWTVIPRIAGKTVHGNRVGQNRMPGRVSKCPERPWPRGVGGQRRPGHRAHRLRGSRAQQHHRTGVGRGMSPAGSATSWPLAGERNPTAPRT